MIREKLKILKENDVIDQKILDVNLEVLELLKDKNVINEDDEADTFITHLAMAMARVEDEELQEMDAPILEEIRADKNFEKAKQLWEEIEEQSPVNFHANETGYFYLHLVNMLS